MFLNRARVHRWHPATPSNELVSASWGGITYGSRCRILLGFVQTQNHGFVSVGGGGAKGCPVFVQTQTTVLCPWGGKSLCVFVQTQNRGFVSVGGGKVALFLSRQKTTVLCPWGGAGGEVGSVVAKNLKK